MSIQKILMPMKRSSFTVLESTLDEFKVGVDKLILNNFNTNFIIFRVIITLILFGIAILSYSFISTHALLNNAQPIYKNITMIRLFVASIFCVVNIFILIKCFQTKKQMQAESTFYLGTVKLDDLSVEFSNHQNRAFVIKTDHGNATIKANNALSFRYFKNFVNN